MYIRSELKKRAKAMFTAQYGVSVGAYILFVLIIGASSFTFVGLLLLFPPLMVGYSAFCLSIWRGGRGDIDYMFSRGFSDYGRSLGGILWMELFIFLWSLLLIVPGIVKSIAYSMTPYILADYPNVRPTEALKLSMRMTQGHKGKIFCLCLSFIGWWLLSVLTCNILGLLFVGPYMNTSLAGMYDMLRHDALTRGVIRPEELA